MNKTLLLKKISFWTLSVLFMAALLVSILHSTKPEWFEGFLETTGVDPSTFQALLTTLGFGGGIGTVGFTLIQSTLSKTLTDTTKLSTQTIEVVQQSVADAVKKIYEEANVNYTKMLEQSKTNATSTEYLIVEAKQQAEKYLHLEETIKKLIDLEIVNTTKTLLNPLVSDETKTLIATTLEKLGVDELTEILNKIKVE